jgi:hypothetical protein
MTLNGIFRIALTQAIVPLLDILTMRKLAGWKP